MHPHELDWRLGRWRWCARGAKHGGNGGRRHGEFLEGWFAEEAFALRQTLQMFYGKEGVCLWREAPPRNNLRASFLRALRVWRRQRYRGGARGAKHGGNGGRRHREFLGGKFVGGACALFQTLNGHFGEKQKNNLFVARSTPLGTISVPPSSARSVFGAASGGCWRLEVFNSER